MVCFFFFGLNSNNGSCFLFSIFGLDIDREEMETQRECERNGVVFIEALGD